MGRGHYKFQFISEKNIESAIGQGEEILSQINIVGKFFKQQRAKYRKDVTKSTLSYKCSM